MNDHAESIERKKKCSPTATIEHPVCISRHPCQEV